MYFKSELNIHMYMYTAKTKISRNNAYPYCVILSILLHFPLKKVLVETYQTGFMTH